MHKEAHMHTHTHTHIIQLNLCPKLSPLPSVNASALWESELTGLFAEQILN